MKQKILALLGRGEEYISGENISRELGISRTAVWKHIVALREEGWEIDSVPRKGYRLKSSPDILYPGEIQRGLETRILGQKIYHFHSLDSTNRAAKDLAEEEAPEGTVVIAEEQTQGRGRMERLWHSPTGGIWMSVILRPELPPYRVQGITLVGAAAVVKAIKLVTGLSPLIKWPNDIYIEGRKVCGILTEMKGETDRIHYIVMGIGINANNDFAGLVQELPTAGSLKLLLGGDVDRKALVRMVLRQLEENYSRYCEEGISSILDLWCRNNCTLGRTVVLKMGQQEFNGTAEDITPEGGLVLRDQQGKTRVFYSGEVTVIGHGGL